MEILKSQNNKKHTQFKQKNLFYYCLISIQQNTVESLESIFIFFSSLLVGMYEWSIDDVQHLRLFPFLRLYLLLLLLTTEDELKGKENKRNKMKKMTTNFIRKTIISYVFVYKIFSYSILISSHRSLQTQFTIIPTPKVWQISPQSSR